MLLSDAAVLGATASIHHSDASPSLKCGPMSHSLTILNLFFPLLDVGAFRCSPHLAKELSPVGKTAWRGSFTALSFLTCAYLSPWFFVGYIGCLKHVFHLRIDVC